MKIFRIALGLAVISWFAASTASAIDTENTKLLSQPAVGGDHVAFVYANDLWVARDDGSYPRRLTSDEGIESNPVFSPDGRWIAFDAQYDGNTDVYIVPVEGGIPTRLTWHPYRDSVCAFTPDGSAVLFRSGRTSFTNRYSQLFTVPVEGGFPTQLELPNAFKATYSPDGSRLAYTPLGERFRVWKNYRGGTVTTIQLYRFSDHATEKVPQPEDAAAAEAARAARAMTPEARAAVERNREIVPRATLADVMVADGDQYEIVHFVGGG